MFNKKIGITEEYIEGQNNWFYVIHNVDSGKWISISSAVKLNKARQRKLAKQYTVKLAQR